MTTNAFIFSWDNTGIESIVPITQYEDWDKIQLMEVIRGTGPQSNPLNHLIGALKLRARANSHRHYEIYAIDCDPELDEVFWSERWDSDPQWCADIVREKGYKIHSDRTNTAKVKIT
jgi:hypothetical protein